MNFLLSDEQEALQETVQRFLDEWRGGKLARDAVDGDGTLDSDFWNEAMGLGIGALTIPAEYDGMGLELIDLALVFEALGAACAPGPFLGHALTGLAITKLGTAEQKARWLPKLASGEIVAAAGLDGPDPAAWTLAPIANSIGGTLRDVAGGADADLILVGLAGGRLGLVGRDGLSATRLDSSDRTRPSADLTFEAAPIELLEGEAGSIVDAALVLLAADAFGGATRCLATTTEYARTREQFGQPIGAFQGVKFQLADLAVEVEPARGLVWYAAHAYDHVPQDAARVAAAAKAHCGEMFFRAARTSIQLHGGIGYTWEHDAQIYFKRAMFDYAWLGTPSLHRHRQAALNGW